MVFTSFVFEFLLLIEMITGCTHSVVGHKISTILWSKLQVSNTIDCWIENYNERSKDPMHFWSIFWSSCRKLGLTWSMPSVRYNVNSLTSCPVEWSKSMRRDTKRINQTIRYAQQKLEPPLMYKIFFPFIMTLCDC